MSTTVTLKSILDEHKIDGKKARRSLRAKFKDHEKGEPWSFTKKQVPGVLAILGVTKATAVVVKS